MRLALILSLAVLGCSDETISGYADASAVYRLEELNGAPTPATATIRFPEQGRAEGDGPCNRWSAAQTAPYPWISLGPIAATERACTDLAFEAIYFDALTKVTLAEVSGNVLILTGEETEMVFRGE